MNLNLSWAHGLGDACQVLPVLNLYRRRGYTVSVKAYHNSAPVFAMAGFDAPLEGIHVPWGYDTAWNKPTPTDNLLPIWNKVYSNLNKDPFPPLPDTIEALWGELTADTSISALPLSRPVENWTDPSPLVLIHPKGARWGGHRNIPDDTLAALVESLLPDYQVGIIDNDQLCEPLPGDVRFFRHLDLPALTTLFNQASILIGIDSGVLHFARYHPIKKIGVFPSHHPSACCLPCPGQVNLCPFAWVNKAIGRQFGIRVCSFEADLLAEAIKAEVERLI